MKPILYYLPILIIAAISLPSMANNTSSAETEQESLLKFRCERYLGKTSDQIGDNNLYGCGFTGEEWSVYEGDHRSWCMQNGNSITQRETHRESKLESCRKMKTSPHNEENQIQVPVTCKNADKSYLPVKQINWIDYISERPMTPVGNGLIEYDFNGDNKNDYVFLEAKEHEDVHANFIICMSNNEKYKRYITDIEIYTMPGLSFLVAQIERQEDQLDLVMVHYERSYGKAYREVSYRFSTEKQQFEVTRTEEGAKNITDREGAYKMTPPAIPKLLIN